MPVPVVLDVDTGVDDACALLFAARHPGLDLRAVSCVAGNADLDQVVRNTLTVLAVAGRADVPVARGAHRPLLEPGIRADVHGVDGMGDLALPHPGTGPDPRPAVDLLRDVLLDAAARGERITLVPLAPMTNVALLLRSYPQVAAGLSRIVFMGGSVQAGNATAAAEFNVWHDPEATAIVLDAAAELSVPVTMYGLDVFTAPRIDAGTAAGLAASDDPVARLAGRLIGFQCQRFAEPPGIEPSGTIGDAGAVCAVVDPAGLTTRRLPVRVELAGRWTRGRTVVDQRPGAADLAPEQGSAGGAGRAPAVLDVAVAVDAGRYAALWLATVSGRLA